MGVFQKLNFSIFIHLLTKLTFGNPSKAKMCVHFSVLILYFGVISPPTGWACSEQHLSCVFGFSCAHLFEKGETVLKKNISVCVD